jgi:hypothetical protein
MFLFNLEERPNSFLPPDSFSFRHLSLSALVLSIVCCQCRNALFTHILFEQVIGNGPIEIITRGLTRVSRSVLIFCFSLDCFFSHVANTKTMFMIGKHTSRSVLGAALCFCLVVSSRVAETFAHHFGKPLSTMRPNGCVSVLCDSNDSLRARNGCTTYLAKQRKASR